MTQPRKNSEASLGLYLRVISYLKGRIGQFLLSVFGFLMFGLSQPMLAKLMELTIEAIETQDATARWYLPAFAILIFVFRGIGSFLGTYFNALVGASVIRQIKLEVFRHMTCLPAAFYDSNAQGQLLHNLNASVTRIRSTVTNALKTVLREGFTIIALTIYVFYLNWQLSLIFLLIAPVLAFLVRIASKKLRAYARRNEMALGEAMQVSKELISNHGLVRSFGAEDYEKARYASAVKKAFKTQMKIRKVGTVFTPVAQLLVACAIGGIIFFLLSPSILAEHTAGDLIGYLTAIGLLPKSIRQLSGVGVTIQRGLVGAEMVFNVLDAEAEQDCGEYEAATDQIEGRIEFRGLSFSYPNSDAVVLKNINAVINSGEMVALVGKSGSGKTTLASLLFRLYDVEQGTLFIDDIDVTKYKLSNLRQHITVVNQNVSLFDDTVRNNIVYGGVEYTDEQIFAALRRAHVLEFVEGLPNGLDTSIGEGGVTLSGGQRQRLSIARAFLKLAPILIFDEATSALDNESELVVSKALQELVEARTALIIAHRLSTVRRADRILVLEAGELVEMGTHEELLSKRGAYHQLYKMEFKSA